MKNEALNEGVMQEVMDGFADEGWEAVGNSVCFKNNEGFIVYENYDYVGAEGGDRELTLWKDSKTGGDLLFQFFQEVTEDSIKNYVIIPPYLDQYVNMKNNFYGVIYGPDGKMDPIRRVKGLPRKIDMDKTVELFLKQVAEKNFAVPVLVKAK